MGDTIELYQYHVWANESVFKHLSNLPKDVYRKPVQSVFPTIGDTLAHIYIVDNVWLTAMSGAMENFSSLLPSWQEEVKDATFERFYEIFSKLASRYELFLTGETDLDAIAEYSHPTYGTLRARYKDIVQHVVNHGTYHRGNISAILRQLGYTGASTDYVFYLYDLNR
ncbi:DinB family protein [Alicyclobacillus dauci]|uniref:DinB family protein n=1 Tax=Alicyclobacillus dauci TaxID=1475485 RepID=A0ABY6Z964_9BACL|nr:DinB family protein [Alicyclobacillus dauci]WAH36261.1 DinB family protein [Alicyclobacillus dauci]WAH39417.1 DinB family protein [Alicyclobacillus dauci]